MKLANSPDPQEMETEQEIHQVETENGTPKERARKPAKAKSRGKDEKLGQKVKSTSTIAARIVREETYPTLEGFGEDEAKAMRPIMQRFLDSYAKKPEDMTDEEWLRQRLSEELPEKSEEEIREMAREIVEGVEKCDKNIASINAACDSGKQKEDWFRETLEEAAIGVNVNAYGNYLANIDIALFEANTQMLRAVTTQSGNISQCFNLDGFIAEQAHVNTFNARAALENQVYRAEVMAPEPGKTYGKNSFDVVIRNIKTNRILHQYQFKFGQDAKATIAMLKNGDYNNQRFVVPSEQLEKVKAAFPDKSISDVLGDTDKVATRSDPLTKEDVKKIQIKAQEKGKIQSLDWNAYNTRDLALHLGKNAALAGIGGATIATGFYMAKKAFEGEEIKANEVVGVALRTGADAGVKAAAAGALKVGIEKGVVPIFAKGTPIGVITTIACVGIENVKIMMKVASGEISGSQGLDLMARTTTAMTAGLVAGAKGAAIGAAMLSFIPIAGPLVGGLIGGMVGYAAGSKVGEMVYEGAKKVVGVAKRAVKAAYNVVKKGCEILGDAISGTVSVVGDVISSAASWVSSWF